MEKDLTILLDFDDVVTPTLEEVLKLHNKDNPNNKYTVEDIKSWSLPDGVSQYFKEVDFESISDKNDSIGAITALLAMPNVEVFIITASHPLNFIKKREWVSRNVPDFPLDNMILAVNKSVIKGDIFVDDAVHNLDTSIATNRILMDMPHNRECKCYRRINSLWELVYEIVK